MKMSSFGSMMIVLSIFIHLLVIHDINSFTLSYHIIKQTKYRQSSDFKHEIINRVISNYNENFDNKNNWFQYKFFTRRMMSNWDSQGKGITFYTI